MASAGAPNPTLKAYEDKIHAEVDQAKARLAHFEAQAKEARTQVETSIINKLETAKENIDRKLHDLKTMHDADVARAKSDIDAAVVKYKASVDEIAAKFRTPPRPAHE